MTKEAATNGAGPAEVRGTGVNKAKRVVASVVEANRDSVGWEPANLGVLERTSDAINVNLERVLADLCRRLVGKRGSNVVTYGVQLSVVIDKEGGELRVPPLVVRSGNENTAFKSDCVAVEDAVFRGLADITLLIDAEVEELWALRLGLPGALVALLVLIVVAILVILLIRIVVVYRVLILVRLLSRL